MNHSDESRVREEARRRLEAVASGQYEVLRALGRGGMGHVFLARDRALGRTVALKVLPPVDALRPASLERFRREAESAAGLTHPHIVPIYGLGGDDATPFIAMAYIEGETLAERIARGPLPEAEALRIIREVGGAVAYAHRHGVIHRDIKPSNVLLEAETGRALLADFGLARAGGGDGLTLSGMALGTPGYMSPEQAGGQPHVDARADIYALGVLLFEMLTGRRFDEIDGGSWPVDLPAVRSALRRAAPAAPPAVCDAVARATAARRDDRFATVEVMLDALGLAPSGAGAAPRGPRAAARLAWTGLALVAVAALGTAAWLVVRGGSRAAPARASHAALALLPLRGDPDSVLLHLVDYQLRGFTTVRLADPRSFPRDPAADPASPVVRARAGAAGAAWIVYGQIGPAGGAHDILVRAVDVRSGDVEDLRRIRVPALTVDAADSVVLLLAQSRVGRDVGLVRGTTAPVTLAAVRAFNAAEEAFRRADYAGAVRGYDSVAALDSGFALARYKRFLAQVQAEPSEPVLRQAVRFLEGDMPRLGPLEQRLLDAYLVLLDSGDVAAAERRLQDLVRDDSTFLDGWFGLAEVRYHFGALAGLPADSAASAFRRVLALWPDAAPAIMHFIALDLFAGRDAEAGQNMARYLAYDSTSAVGRTVALGRAARMGSVGERLALMRRLAQVDDRVLEFGAINGVQIARDRFDVALARTAMEEMTSAARPAAVRLEGARLLVLCLASEGRFSDADRALASLRRALPRDRELERLPRLLRELRAPPAVADTARAIAQLRDSLRRLDAPHVPFGVDASRWPQRWRLAGLALARGDTAAALRELLAFDFLAAASDQVVRGPAWLMRGRILAARGQVDAARRYLRRSADLLKEAEAPWDAVRDSARAELERLGRAP